MLAFLNSFYTKVNALYTAFPPIREALTIHVLAQGTLNDAYQVGEPIIAFPFANQAEKKTFHRQNNVLNALYRELCAKAEGEGRDISLFPPALNLPGPASGQRLHYLKKEKCSDAEFAHFDSKKIFEHFFREVLLYTILENVRASFSERFHLLTPSESEVLSNQLTQHLFDIGMALDDLLDRLYASYKKEPSIFYQELKMIGERILPASQKINFTMSGFSRGGGICLYMANLLDKMFANHTDISLVLLDPATGGARNKDPVLHQYPSCSNWNTTVFGMHGEALPLGQLSRKIKQEDPRVKLVAFEVSEHSDINRIRDKTVNKRLRSKHMVRLALDELERNYGLEPGSVKVHYISSHHPKVKVLKRLDQVSSFSLSSNDFKIFEEYPNLFNSAKSLYDFKKKNEILYNLLLRVVQGGEYPPLPSTPEIQKELDELPGGFKKEQLRKILKITEMGVHIEMQLIVSVSPMQRRGLSEEFASSSNSSSSQASLSSLLSDEEMELKEVARSSPLSTSRDIFFSDREKRLPLRGPGVRKPNI